MAALVLPDEVCNGRLQSQKQRCQVLHPPTHTPYFPLPARLDILQSFGIAGAAFVATECSIEKWRARHDVFNAVFAGITAGAAMGAWNARAAAAPGEARTLHGWAASGQCILLRCSVAPSSHARLAF